MAARNRYKRRKRKGSFSFLYKLLVFFAVCGAIVAALAEFFKVDAVVVTGNSRYTAEEIAESGNLRVGDNLFLINKFQAAEQIMQQLPYVSQVQISRKLPDTLLVAVTENATLCAVQQSGSTWLISTSGKLVEQTSAAADNAIPVTGITLQAPRVGSSMEVPAEQETAKTTLLQLVQTLEELQVQQRCKGLDFSDASVITMAFDDRFQVQLAWDADFNYKLQCMLTVIDTKLEANEKGTIDLTRDAVRFIPG